MPSDADLIREARLTEYKVLKAEMLQRIALRQQITSLTLTIAGGFFAFGLSSSNGIALLAYPLLVFFLALAWQQNDDNLRRLASYVRVYIEEPIRGLNWETWLHAQRQPKQARPDGTVIWRRTAIAHGSIYLVTQIVAMVLGLLLFFSKPFGELRYLVLFLFILGISSIINVFIVFYRVGRNTSYPIDAG